MFKISFRLFLFTFIATIFLSCKRHIATDDFKSMPNLTVVKINSIAYFKSIDFDKYFRTWQLVPLSTSKESLIGRIDRVSRFKNRFYILDRQSKSLFVFNDAGGFLFKIHKAGRGPGEYLGLMDFTIDENANQLILHTDRPAKLEYFDMDGNFIKEIEMENFFTQISYNDRQLIFTNPDPDLKNHFFIKSTSEDKLKGFVPIDKRGELYRTSGTFYPYSIKSNGLFFTLPFSNIVYQQVGNTIIPKYGLDFGTNAIPSNYFDQKKSAVELLKQSYRSHYGFGLSNYRETKKYMVFSYADNITVICDKKTKENVAFHLIINSKDNINFENYFGHDGDDNAIMTVCQASFFTKQMSKYKKSPSDWAALPDSVKTLSAVINSSSNPLLIFYYFKD